MRLQMATPWNAVIAETRHIAEQYMDAFGLSIGLIVVANAVSNAIEDLSEKVEALSDLILFPQEED